MAEKSDTGTDIEVVTNFVGLNDVIEFENGI